MQPPPNLKSKNLNLIYKNISKSPIRGGHENCKGRAERLVLISQTLDFIFKVLSKLSFRCFDWNPPDPCCVLKWITYEVLSCGFTVHFLTWKSFHTHCRTFMLLLNSVVVDASNSCNQACDGFLMRGSVWQVKCSYRSYFSWLLFLLSTLFLLTSVSIRRSFHLTT